MFNDTAGCHNDSGFFTYSIAGCMSQEDVTSLLTVTICIIRPETNICMPIYADLENPSKDTLFSYFLFIIMCFM